MTVTNLKNKVISDKSVKNIRNMMASKIQRFFIKKKNLKKATSMNTVNINNSNNNSLSTMPKQDKSSSNLKPNVRNTIFIPWR